MTPITPAWPFSQWGIDIVGPLPMALGGARLGKTHQGWVDELPHVLWAHSTTPKSSNRETPFSLVFGSEVVVPIEISIETKRIKELEIRQNKKRRREDLDILVERREISSIRKGQYKQKLEGYYNKRVWPSTFKPGTYVLRLNSASKVEFQGKMGPTWEGPYVVKNAYGDGAYKLETLSGSPVDRTWNGSNLHSGANERPPMLERGNYIPCESRFRRFLDNKLEDGEQMWNLIQNGPYVRPMIPNPDDIMKQILEPFHVRHSRLMDEFDKFAAKEGELLESVYEILTTLVNIMDRNNVRPIPVSINTKFLNLQFEPHVLASKAKNAPKNHDPLALLVHSNTSSSQSHANSSYSPQPYYVIYPSSVVDYEDEYQREL
ncbi:reverse transcriptase domain-containing protein [Tanacetum coccineum]